MAGDMQNILNETIQRIKELKVGEKLNEAGMPTGDHATILEQKIEVEITNFETLMSNYIANNYTAFQAQQSSDFSDCVDAADTAFDLIYIDTTPTPDIGV